MLGIEAYAAVGILALAFVLFVTEALAAEIVALMVMVLLMLTGILSPAEGVAGFSNPATLTVLALFILSGGVYRSGAVSLAARRLALVTGKSETRILLLLIVVVGPVAAFVNNTAAVAILLPLVLSLAKEAHASPSRLLIPLSFVAMLAGTLTLIGTSTNILASSLVERETGRGFGMFEFSAVGLVVFTTGVLYLLLVGRRLLPERIPAGDEADATRARLGMFLSEARVLPESPLVGRTLHETRMPEKYRMDVVRIVRGGTGISPAPYLDLQAGDLLVVRGPRDRLGLFESEAGVEMLPSVRAEDVGVGEDATLAEIVISPTSTLVRRTISEADIERDYSVRILGLRKHRPAGILPLQRTRLEFGDTLLVLASPEAVRRLREEPDVIVGAESPQQPFHRARAILSITIIAGVVGLAALGIYPILVAALGGGVLMVLTRVLRPEDLWTSVRWNVVFLLAGIIPLGLALEKTGVAAAVGQGIAGVAAGLPDVGLLMLFYLTSMLLTETISNNATIVLLTPVAFATAASLGISPIPLVVAAMFAASASFMTPIGYQTNLMVYGPGGYRFTDFTRIGAPLNVLLLVVTSFTISALVPFR